MYNYKTQIYLNHGQITTFTYNGTTMFDHVIIHYLVNTDKTIFVFIFFSRMPDTGKINGNKLDRRKSLGHSL